MMTHRVSGLATPWWIAEFDITVSIRASTRLRAIGTSPRSPKDEMNKFELSWVEFWECAKNEKDDEYITESCFSTKSNIILVMSDIIIDYHILLGIDLWER